ncbi:MAG: hypothetical protein PUC29_08550 [Clostridia bacterium]|nr:hypothetical protein [Clostridia bacterium]
MNSEKRKQPLPFRLCLVGVLCASLLILGIGTAQARYRNSTEKDIAFQAEQLKQVFLWSDTGGELSDLTPLADWTQTKGGGAKLSFKVSNGTSEESFCSEPLSFNIRVAASLGIMQNTDNVRVCLKIDGEQYTAVAEPILKGTSRYEKFGPGVIYSFYDEKGVELSWQLTEDSLSVVKAELTVEGVGEYAGLLRLEATAF